MSHSNNSSGTAAYKVSLQNAISWITNWRNKYNLSRNNNGVEEPVQINAFTLSKGDFNEIMSNPDVHHVRLYLAAGPYNDGTGDREVVKVLVVGTDEGGNHIHLTEIYDLSHPCPSRCDEDSPLQNITPE